MKKKIKVLLLIILIGALLYGVLVIKSNREFDKVDNISIEIKEGTLTNTSATVIITDKSLEKNDYNNAFTIYKKNFGLWTKVKNQSKWVSSTSYHVDDSGKLEMKCNFSHLKLDKGIYRLSKWVIMADRTSKNVYVEFQIK